MQPAVDEIKLHRGWIFVICAEQRDRLEPVTRRASSRLTPIAVATRL